MSAPDPNAASFRQDDGSLLHERLRSATRRIRFVSLVRALSPALLVAAVVDLLALLAGRLGIAPQLSPWLLALPYLLAAIVAALYAGFRPLAELQVARATERRAGLNERLSSVLELSESGDEPFVQALCRDTAGRVASIDIPALYPARAPRTLAVAALLTILWLGATLLPVLRHAHSASDRRDAEEVARRGAEIERIARDTQKAADQHGLAETRKAALEAGKLGHAMRAGRLSKKESLVALQKLTRKMEETEKRLAEAAGPKPPEQAQREFQKAVERMQQAANTPRRQNSDPNGARRQEASNQNSAAGKPASPAMQQAKSALAQMQDAMRQMDPAAMKEAMKSLSDAMRSGQLSPEQMKQLSMAMQALAQSLNGTCQGGCSPSLQQLAQQMQANGGSSAALNAQGIAAMMTAIGQQMGRCQGGMDARLDAQTMAGLCRALQEGRLTMVMGSCNRPGMSIRTKGPGKGWYGYGDPHAAMKDPGATKARLLAAANGLQKPGQGKQGSAQELAKYMAQHSAPPKHLPNGKIAGMRSVNGQELTQNSTGDPDGAQAGSTYYQVYQTNRRAAEDTVNKESIPASYKKQVRDYFDTIRP
jgi:hypothetical protein